VALLVREGDPRPAVAVAVLTAGVDPGRGAEVPVALAAVVEARLRAAGFQDSLVVPGAEGFRVRSLLSADEARGDLASAPAIVEALRQALLTPLAPDAREMLDVKRKLAALAERPLPDPALRAVVECTGEPFAGGGTAPDVPVIASVVETWRAASHGLSRVALAAVGAGDAVDAIAMAVAESQPWPRGAPVTPAPPPPNEDIQVYEAPPDLPPGAARVSIALGVPSSERAVRAADTIADPRSSFVTHLTGLEPLARTRSLTATAHAGWGCLEVTVDLPSPDGVADPPISLAAVTDLVRAQLLADLESGSVGTVRSGRDVANRAGDPRDAAERLAYWTVMSSASRPLLGSPTMLATVVGLSPARSATSGSALAERGAGLRAELERAKGARREPLADVKVRVEPGQSALWALLASPCGTLSETDADAGSGALAVTALAERARRGAEGSGAMTEDWVTTEGLGLIVHAETATETSGLALARRVGERLAKSFGASLGETADLAWARTMLLAHPPGGEMQRTFSLLADAVSPGHPSWLWPSGTTESLERSSDDAVRVRLDALREGPLRVAVLADHDASEAEVVLETLGAWLPHRARRPSACPGAPTAPQPRPGTYAVEATDSSSEAWLAFPLPPGDGATRACAALVAAALAARGGLLERALGAGLARSWGSRVLGSTRAPALVVRVGSTQGSLDAAVAETRVLVDRLRREGLAPPDRTLALSERRDAWLEKALDPKARLVALWRGDGEPEGAENPPPSADELRAFAAQWLHDEGMILVVSRPPRGMAIKAP
jgi:hypothetical protein